MSRYEKLISKHKDLEVNDTLSLPASFSGFYTDGVAFVDKNLSSTQKLEVLAEEVAHYKLSYGNILDSDNIMNRKYENRARGLAKEMICSLDDIIEAYENGITDVYDLAEYLEISVKYIIESLNYYKQKHGLTKLYKGYEFTFNPFNISKI